ncbi:hypothetical protein Tsubulata_038308, partial [Turnera subulata]
MTLMIWTQVLKPINLCSSPEEPSQSPASSLKFKEQECLSLLKRCKSIAEFKKVHVQVLKWGLFLNPFCASNLLATCALSDWGSMDYACSIFRQIDEPGTFEYNTMIRGYIKCGHLETVLFLYHEMLVRGVPSDNFTYPALLKACARLKALEEAIQIHGHVFKLGLEEDLFVQNSLISMYGKCGKIELSCSVFEQMEQRDVASWSAIISAHASVGIWCECLMLFGEMSRETYCRPQESIL